jgi:hypothetical protein
VVLVSDPIALLGLHPELSVTRVAACTPWPALNNTAGGNPYADRVILRGPLGRVSDAWSCRAAIPGRVARAPLARESEPPALDLGASAVSGGTPGRANSIDAGAFVPGSRWSRGRWKRRAAVVPHGFERANLSRAVYDLRGRLVRALLDGEDGPGRAGVAWDGKGPGGEAVAPGVYVAGLTAREPGSGAVARARTCVVVR